ncbi:MAG: GDYXXLXY domain-containing protein [Candidatus Falkowbacteria bacterium]
MENKTINKKILFTVLGLIFLVFLGLILVNEYKLNAGEEVILLTRPVDPRDYLRGDYVILSYQIETDEKVTNFIKENKLDRGDSLYVVLKKNEENIGEVEKVLRNKPEDGQIFIKGTIEEDFRTIIDLGIGKYFVPEGRGREIERLSGNLEVMVNITSGGEAKIKGIYDKGELIDFKEKN